MATVVDSTDDHLRNSLENQIKVSAELLTKSVSKILKVIPLSCSSLTLGGGECVIRMRSKDRHWPKDTRSQIFIFQASVCCHIHMFLEFFINEWRREEGRKERKGEKEVRCIRTEGLNLNFRILFNFIRAVAFRLSCDPPNHLENILKIQYYEPWPPQN